MLLPGFEASHRSLAVLGAYLLRIGHDVIERAVADRFTMPIRVPVVVVCSKRDGIVA